MFSSHVAAGSAVAVAGREGAFCFLKNSCEERAEGWQRSGDDACCELNGVPDGIGVMSQVFWCSEDLGLQIRFDDPGCAGTMLCKY